MPVTTEDRERIYIAKACARAIVAACTTRMSANYEVLEKYNKVRLIQLKYGQYLFESLEDKGPEDLENLLVLTPALIKRLHDPNDTLENIL